MKDLKVIEDKTSKSVDYCGSPRCNPLTDFFSASLRLCVFALNCSRFYSFHSRGRGLHPETLETRLAQRVSSFIRFSNNILDNLDTHDQCRPTRTALQPKHFGLVPGLPCGQHNQTGNRPHSDTLETR